MTKCIFITKRNGQCGNNACYHDLYCWVHDPSNREQVLANVKKSAAVRNTARSGAREDAP